MNDFKFAIRQLVKNPGFTAVAVLTLALGIGANTAIFSVINAVLLRPLPFLEPDRIVQIWSQKASVNNSRIPPSLPDFTDWRAQIGSFSHLAYYRLADFHFTGVREPAEVRAGRVSPGFFDVFGVAPFLGRTFLAEEDVPGKDQVVVLGYSIWQQRFGGDRQIVGKSIGVEGRSCVVCGVMPSQFKFPESAAIWIPFAMTPDQIGSKRDDHFNLAVGRLEDNIPLAAAQTEMSTIAVRLEREYPDSNKSLGVVLVPLHEDLVGDVRPGMLLLLGAVGAVLLIACANTANLQLARGLARQKEIAVRLALGASPARIVRQFLTESVLLSVLGGAVGLLAAYGAIDVLIALAPANIPRIAETRLDGTVLAVCLGLSIGTGILFGLFPSLQALRIEFAEQLKEGSKGATGGTRRHRARNALVIAEITLAFVLLIGGELVLKSFHRLNGVILGFDPQDLATIRISLPWKHHVDGTDKLFFHQLNERIRVHPGLEQSALVRALPIADRQVTVWFKLAGEAVEPGKEPVAGFNYITPSYFDVMRIPLIRGRGLNDQDTPSSPRVVVVDESLTKRYFPNEEPLGRRVLVEGQGDQPFTIVGIVGGVRQRVPSQPPTPQLYLHSRQINEGRAWLVVRGASRVRGLDSIVGREVRRLDADQSISPLRTMEEHLYQSSQLPRFRAVLLSLLALLAFVLASVGIYGVMACSVTQRTRELGIRVALGAKRRDILNLILAQSGKMAVLGIGFGIVIALGAVRLLSSMLYEVSPRDAETFLVIPAIVALVVLATSYLPARRAARVDPMEALRHE